MNQQPHWRPITMLPVFIEMIDGMLQTSVEQLGCLQLVHEKQHVLGNTLLARLNKQYTEQLRDHWLLDGQLEYWLQDELRSSEKRAVDRLVQQANLLQENSRAILRVIYVIEHDMMEEAMTMDEFAWLQAWRSGKFRSLRSAEG